jgi:transcriptional regulator with XRE-family HTH domain
MELFLMTELAGAPQPSEQTATLVGWRQQLGVSQLTVATACKIDLSKYSKWERGYARISDLQTVAVVNFLVARMTTLQNVIPQGTQELSQIREGIGA